MQINKIQFNPNIKRDKYLNMYQEKPNLQNQVAQICNMCMTTGIHKSLYDGDTKLLSHMPVSFYPYEITETTYQKLRKAHLIWVKLLLKVSKDKEFVNKVFERTAKSDTFVNKFLELYNKYIDQQNYGVACIRIDYMGDEHPQMVEYNLVSVGLNGISDGVQRLTQLYKKHRSTDSEVFYPINKNQVTLLNAIQSTLKQQKIDGIALMVVHEKHLKEFNFGDQNAFELQALRRKIKVKRVTMTEFIEQYKVNENKELFFNSQKVAVVYFRTAYSPAHYPTQQHWIIRQEIERANVLSIPSISMQLVNFKRMQVELSKIDVLRKFLDQQDAVLLKQLSGELYDFQNEAEIEKLQYLANSNNYVLKSNRQGGGNNYFGEQAAKKIAEFSKVPGELEKYILQNKIKSDIQDNIFIANNRYLEVSECTCEYSTFGSYAYKKEQLRFNECGGNLIRLKRAEQNQGGISIDKAVIAGLCVKKSK